MINSAFNLLPMPWWCQDFRLIFIRLTYYLTTILSIVQLYLICHLDLFKAVVEVAQFEQRSTYGTILCDSDVAPMTSASQPKQPRGDQPAASDQRLPGLNREVEPSSPSLRLCIFFFNWTFSRKRNRTIGKTVRWRLCVHSFFDRT